MYFDTLKELKKKLSEGILQFSCKLVNPLFYLYLVSTQY